MSPDKCAAAHFSQKHSKTMDMIYVRILLCISFVRHISQSDGVNIVTSTFRVRAKHHGKDRIRKCAMKVLQNTTVIGGGISDSTGHCEEVTHSLAQKQTFESGYGHVDKISFIKAYQPAWTRIGPEEIFETTLPIPLSVGSKLEFTFDRTPPYLLISEFVKNEFVLAASSEKEKTVPFKWETFCRLSKCKLTFVIHDWGIKNDRKITDITSEEMSTLLQGMKRISGNVGTGVKLRKLEVQG